MEFNKEEAKNIPNKINASDHLANERTFLAWIRTSIAVMGFGFVVVKFSIFIKQLTLALGQKLVFQGKGYSTLIGVLLVGTGALIALFAFIHYRNIERRLLSKSYKPSLLSSLLLALLIFGISILLILYLIPGIGI